jgi:hypothetical protein
MPQTPACPVSLVRDFVARKCQYTRALRPQVTSAPVQELAPDGSLQDEEIRELLRTSLKTKKKKNKKTTA